MTGSGVHGSHQRWPVERLRFSIISNPVRSEVGNCPDEATVSFVPMDAVGEFGEFDASQERPIAEVYAGYTYFAEGDVLVAKITPCFENGKGAIAQGLANAIGFGTTEFHVLRSLPRVSERWLFYLTASDRFRKVGASAMLGAGGQKRVPESFIKDFRTGIPPLEEQQQIADFLDWKTGQIDALIAKKRELIKKLKEKRLSLITQALTKGLDPDARLRDSDVAWLGAIPKNWTVRRLKFLATIRYGLGEPPEYVEEGLSLVRATDISRGTVAREGFKKIRSEDVPWERNPTLQKDEIIVVRSGAYTGDSAIIPEELEGAVAGFDMVVTATDMHPEFLAWTLLSPYLLDAQIYQARLRAAQPHLNSQELGDFVVVVPPRIEQQAIVDNVKLCVRNLDLMILKVDCAMTRLTEYRSALITAATTGKIDVRAIDVPA